jgi:hypothetical protein
MKSYFQFFLGGSLNGVLNNFLSSCRGLKCLFLKLIIFIIVKEKLQFATGPLEDSRPVRIWLTVLHHYPARFQLTLGEPFPDFREVARSMDC